jgi:hypothetical protein
MKKSFVGSATLFLLGLMVTNLVIFADKLGVDQHAGWGYARIGFLFFGFSIIVFSALLYRYMENVYLITRKFKEIFKRIPVQYFSAPIVIIVIIIYTWFGSSGKWTSWKTSTFYYDSQAKGFLKSELYLPIEPDPKLLKLPNPYDHSARTGIDTPVDISLYKGKYYMYWGPVPSLLLTVIYGFYHVQIGDFALTFGFVCGIYLLQTLLLHSLWKQYFCSLPRWILYLSILLIGLAGPLIFLRHNYENARIYEASITGGQLFFMGGLLVALTAVTRSSISSSRLVTAGILWALAIGTRLILAAPIGFMILMLALWLFKANAWSFVKTSAQLISLSLPLAIGFSCLGWYNWARFDSVTESGLYYALAGWDFQEHYNELFSQGYIFQNLYNYLFKAIDFLPKFPFVFMPLGSETPILPFYSVPNLYNAQPIAGLFYTFPFAIFAGVPFFLLILRKKSAQNLVDTSDRKHLNLITLSLSGSFLMAFSLLIVFFWVGIRYAGDFTPSLMALSIIGFWQGYQLLTYKTLLSRFYIIFGVTLASASILLSVLLAISTNSGLVKLIIHRFPFL